MISSSEFETGEYLLAALPFLEADDIFLEEMTWP